MPSAAIPTELRETAKALWLEGVPPSRIADKLQINRKTVVCWVHRHWSKDQTLSTIRETMSPLPQPVQQKSEFVRSRLASALAEHANLIDKKRLKSVAPLGNTRARQGLAAVAKTVAETASIVFGWSKQDTPGSLVIIGEGESSHPQDVVERAKPIVEISGPGSGQTSK